MRTIERVKTALVDERTADELDELHIYCEALLQDHALAREIGNAGREAAIPIFGKEAAKAAWREVLS